MRVVARSNDPVQISFLMCLLADAGIAAFLLDVHVSLLEGSTTAIPRSIAVATRDETRALRLLADAGEA